MQILKTAILAILLCSCTQNNGSETLQNNFPAGPAHFRTVGEADGRLDYPYVNRESIGQMISEGRASFIIFGIVSHDYTFFEKKYGIRIKTENCVRSSSVLKNAVENNRLIAHYLTTKYQDKWKEDLSINLEY